MLGRKGSEMGEWELGGGVIGKEGSSGRRCWGGNQAQEFKSRERAQRGDMAYQSHTAPYWGENMNWQRDREGSGCGLPIQGTVTLDCLIFLVRPWGLRSGHPSPEEGSVENGWFSVGSPTPDQGILGPDWDFWAPGSYPPCSLGGLDRGK